MCTVCGCGKGETRIEGTSHAQAHGHEHAHAHADEHAHDHSHEHEHDHHHHHHAADGSIDFGGGVGGGHVPGLSQARMVQIEQDILGKNDAYAERNRERLAAQGVFALNLVSSPGAGKTTLLTRTIGDLSGELAMAVIEGDQQTSNDAERIRATGVPAIQINTGKGCHLDAHMVGHALDSLALERDGVLFIENVGNLVCPAAFDLGEACKVVILSVTEGEDKPLKYPNMFDAARLMVLNKVDLLPHLDFDVERCLDYARRINPDIEVVQVSATKGQGLDEWYAWLRAGRHAVMEQRVRRLEQELAAARERLGAGS